VRRPHSSISQKGFPSAPRSVVGAYIVVKPDSFPSSTPWLDDVAGSSFVGRLVLAPIRLLQLPSASPLDEEALVSGSMDLTAFASPIAT